MGNESVDFSRSKSLKEYEDFLDSMNRSDGGMPPPSRFGSDDEEVAVPPRSEPPAGRSVLSMKRPLAPMVPPMDDPSAGSGAIGIRDLVSGSIRQKLALPSKDLEVSELADAQKEAAERKKLADFGSAASHLGHAIAGVRAPQTTAYDALRKDADQPVEDLLARRKATAENEKVKKDQEFSDPKSPASVISRKLARQRLASSDQDPSIITDDMSALDVENVKSGIAGIEGSATKKELAALRKDQAEEGRSDKKEKQKSKDLTTLGDALDENKGRAGELGRQAQTVNNADRVLALAKQFPDYNFPKAQMAELAGAAAALVTGGSHPAEGIIQQYIPHTMAGSAAGIQEWLTNNATPAQTQSFAKLMVETAEREKALAQGKVKAAKFARVSHFGHLRGDPEFNNVLESHGVDPSEYDTYVKRGHKMDEAQPEARQGSSAPAASAAGMVTIVTPSGKRMAIPKENVQKAIARGAKVEQ